MKKLSIIMVVAMLLTTFGAMFVVPASAAEVQAPVGTVAPTPVPLTETQADAIVAAGHGTTTAGGIGYFTVADGVDKVYCDTLVNVGKAIVAIGTEQTPANVEFVLTSDEAITSTQSQGNPTMDLGTVGNTLTINGQNQHKLNYSANRVFHYDGDRAGGYTRNASSAMVVFKNIDIIGQTIQINDGVTLVFDNGADVDLSGGNGIIIGKTCKVVCNAGSTVDNTGGVCFLPNGVGSMLELNGGTFTASTDTIKANTAGVIVNINGGTLTCGSTNATTTTANRIYNSNSKADAVINITGGTLNGGNQYLNSNNKTTSIPGGVVYVNGGTLTVSAADPKNPPVLNCVRPIQTAAAGYKINLNGGTIVGSDIYTVSLKHNGTLTVDGATINNTHAKPYGAIMVEGAGATVNINSGTINVSAATGASSGSTAAVWSRVKCNVNIKNVTVEGAQHAVGFGTVAGAFPDDSTVNIYGGTMTGAVYYAAGMGITTNIYGGTFTSESDPLVFWSYTRCADRNPETLADGMTAVEAKDVTDGYINIYGGTFNATGTNRVIVSKNGTNGEGKNINIYGGTFESRNTAEFSVAGTQNPDTGAWGYSDAEGGAFYISAGYTNVLGGEYTLKNSDGTTATEGFHFNVWAGGRDGFKLLGGSFTGGQYAFAKYAASEGTGVAGDNQEIGNYLPTTTDGASIRIANDSTGIRFEGQISADMVTWAKAQAGAEGTVSYGMIIAPKDFVDQAGALHPTAIGEGNYVLVEAKNGLIGSDGAGYTVRAALINIQDKNREFVANTYVCINGEYVLANAATPARSANYVAKAALADVVDEATTKYTTAVYEYYQEAEGGFELVTGAVTPKFSRFSLGQIAFLKAYIA